jgi:6,7-dimethyl-8-ribityllumazine synthase
MGEGPAERAAAAGGARGLRFALVASRFNERVVERLIDGARGALLELGAAPGRIALFRVPGAFEIPQVARRLALSDRYDAVVCLGAVVRGETPHFDYVAGEAARGVAEVAREATAAAVVFGVLTTDNLEQALDRAGGKAGNKGAEAASAAVEMALLLRSLPDRPEPRVKRSASGPIAGREGRVGARSPRGRGGRRR